jgi:aldose sugar dehydrogenase
MKKHGNIQDSVLLCAFAFFLLATLTAGVNEAFSQPRVMKQVVEEKIESELVSFRIVKIIEGLEHPWAIAWLPDGRMLITERPGRMHLVDGDKVHEFKNLPEIHHQEDQLTAPQGGSQAGLLDVAVHPDFGNNGWIYFTFSSPGDNDGVDDELATGTALARARLNNAGTDLTDLETLYASVPRTEPGRHYGSRILFPGDGTVIFSIGDRGLRGPAQDLTDPAGSMIRLLENGGASPENPFVGAFPGNLRPEIYSFGHRNNQGLTQNPSTGEIWAIDHGPYGGDLLYKIEAGNNYGWPQVSYGVEYSTRQHMGIGREAPGVTKPSHIWEYSMAPSGLAFYNGEVFPAWHGNLFVGSLLLERIYRIEFENGEVSHTEILIPEKTGRIRDVRQGPDGYIYFATDEGDGGIFRLEPVN